MHGEAPLTITLADFAEGGVGSQLWDASIALLLYLRSDHAARMLSPDARVLELGAGLALPSFDLARRVAHVTVTDAWPTLFELARVNEAALRQDHAAAKTTMAPVEIAELRWGEVTMENQTGLLRQCNTSRQNPTVPAPAASFVGRDVVLGSDVAYDDAGAESLAALLPALHAKVAIIIGPVTRAAMHTLEQHVRTSSAGSDLRLEVFKITLTCRQDESDATMDPDLLNTINRNDRVRSSGVHQVLILRRDDRRH